MDRNYSLDFFKFFAIFFVVCIHTSPFLDTNTNLYLIINSFARFGVPFFFMASGYLFGQKLKDTKDPVVYARTYCIKIAKLYVFWVFVYFIFDLFLTMLATFADGGSLKLETTQYLRNFFDFKILYYGTETNSLHLWYLVALFWAIIVVYVFVRLQKVTALLILSLALTIIGLLGQSYSVLLDIPIQTRDALFFGLFYTTMGYYFSSTDKKLKISQKGLLCLIIAFSILQPIEALILIHKFDAELGSYYFSTIPLSIFLFAYVLKARQLMPSNLFSKIGGQAVGIYILHPLFILLISTTIKFIGLDYIKQTVVWNILFAPSVFCISYIFYVILYKLKTKLITHHKIAYRYHRILRNFFRRKGKYQSSKFQYHHNKMKRYKS